MVRSAFAFAALLAVAALSTNDAAAQAVEGRLKTILSTKKIKIAHRVDSTPFSFVDERNQPTGYTIDICKSVVGSIGRQFKVSEIEIQWVPVTSQSRFDVVASGDADMECGASTVTLSRMKIVDFSNYVFVESTGVAVMVKSGIGKAADLAGKKVGVISGTTNEQAIVTKSKEFAMDIVRFKERAEAIAALEAGKIDAYASDKLLLVGANFKDPTAMKLLPDDLSVEPYAIALPRGDWQLRLAVNTGLAEVMRGTEMTFIFNSWFGRLGFQPGLLMSATFILNRLAD
jgi:glutamate/aspartate transport system substrate-binding protein